VKLFKTKLIKVNDGEMAKAAALMISTMDTTKPTSVDLKATKRLTEAIKREEDTMDEDTKASSTKNINKISTLMKLLLLFPIEYYEKNERPQVLYISTLIDIWSVTYVSADLLSRVKVSLMCRSLHMRFIDYFSINSILVRIENITFIFSLLNLSCVGIEFCHVGLVGHFLFTVDYNERKQ
jgi:hypothetical protein